MSQLPFLVRHGTETWVAAWIASVAAVSAWLRHRRATWSRVAAYASGTALVALFGMIAAGRLALYVGRDRESPRVAYEATNADALAVAAALPGSRGDALAELVDQFDRHYVRDDSVLQAWQEAERLRGGCRRELAMLRRQERIRQLELVARTCDDAGAASAALLFLGDYGEAARRGGDDAPVAQLATRNWSAMVSRVSRMRGARWGCIEVLFRTLAGEHDAAATLHAGDDLVCDVVGALLQPAPAPALVAVYRRAPDSLDLSHAIEALLWINGGGVRPPWHTTLDPEALAYIAPTELNHTDAATLWPLAHAARPTTDDPLQEGVARLWHAGYLVARGDLANAGSEIAAQAWGDPILADASRSLAVAVALRGGHPISGDAIRDYLHPAIRDAADLARGKGPAGGRIGIGCEDEGIAVAQLDALQGDGNRLADLADRCGLRAGLGIEAWFGLVPHIRNGRERIASQIEAAAPDFVEARDPFAVISRALLRRDLARLAGDDEATRRWQTVLDRHLDVLSDRDVATSLIVWQLVEKEP